MRESKKEEEKGGGGKEEEEGKESVSIPEENFRSEFCNKNEL